MPVALRLLPLEMWDDVTCAEYGHPQPLLDKTPPIPCAFSLETRTRRAPPTSLLRCARFANCLACPERYSSPRFTAPQRHVVLLVVDALIEQFNSRYCELWLSDPAADLSAAQPTSSERVGAGPLQLLRTRSRSLPPT